LELLVAYVHGGVPLTWDDCAAPAFSAGTGSAAPTIGDFVGSGNGVVRLLAFTENTEDRVHVSSQVQHDLYIPSSGNVVFSPHVHFTFLAEPTTGETVIFEYTYVYAKPGITATAAGAFASSVGTCTGTYTATGDTEIRKHLLLELTDITVAAADCAPSMIFVGTLRLTTDSTVAAGNTMLLSFDIHYQKGPVGTNGEYS
jgi:hypothetical protein